MNLSDDDAYILEAIRKLDWKFDWAQLYISLY